MMTRDSHAWWFVMGGALIVAISSRMDLIDPLLPAQHTRLVHAVVELLAYLVGVGAGVARMSPLAISHEGRAQAIQKNADRSDEAQVSANIAAVAADQAAKASTIAAEASQAAAEQSTKASGIQDK